MGGETRFDGEDASTDFVDIGPAEGGTTHISDTGSFTEAQLVQSPPLGGLEVRTNPGDENGLPDACVAEGEHHGEESI
jgi:hypothetical protein